MGRPKTIKDLVRVTCTMSKAQHERIKLMCIRMSTQERRQITPSEAIRMALETAYPLPKGTGDLFK
jgi:hypothetical protein